MYFEGFGHYFLQLFAVGVCMHACTCVAINTRPSQEFGHELIIRHRFVSFSLYIAGMPARRHERSIVPDTFYVRVRGVRADAEARLLQVPVLPGITCIVDVSSCAMALQFGWTHLALLAIVVQSQLIIQNIYSGLIWSAPCGMPIHHNPHQVPAARIHGHLQRCDGVHVWLFLWPHAPHHAVAQEDVGGQQSHAHIVTPHHILTRALLAR